MSQQFYQSLSTLLSSGESAHLLTALSGEFDGLDMIARKALLHGGILVPEEERLRGFWEAALPQVSSEKTPCVLEICGVRLLSERLSSRQQLIICGGGHISAPLAAIGAMIDFDVTVIDDRPEFANASRFPSAKQVICAPFKQVLPTLTYTDESYFVIVTRGHADDRTCLEEILRHRFGYCGMIGSRKKVAVVMEQMAREGYAQELLDRVYAPIGLRIGGQTPAEIAVSINAQLVQVRSNVSEGSFDQEGLRLLAEGSPMMLATIVEKRGSAPRSTGAKMLVSSDGRIFGTVGGGAAEAGVIAAAPSVLSSGVPCIKEFNMTNDDARKAGMVCGGTILVLLEPIR